MLSVGDSSLKLSFPPLGKSYESNIDPVLRLKFVETNEPIVSLSDLFLDSVCNTPAVFY